MKNLFRKTLSAFLAVSLLCSVSAAALASDAMGEDLTAKDTQLHEETQLSTNVFWSSSYSDLRTENLITYAPNEDVTPIVTYGGALTDRSTVTAMAKQLEAQGYRVVAGLNGDFYNVNTGLPIGLVVAEGELRSSDAGYYAVGFRSDGTAVMGKPAVKATADLGYQNDQGTTYIRQLSGINKARVSTGGIYLYTHDFNAKHTTGATEPGIDVVCTMEDGKLSIGDTLTLRVEQVAETTTATPIREDQVVLSVNLKSDPFHVEALRNIPVGGEINLDFTASSDEWNDVDYAVGALYSLVENGVMTAGLPAGANPRTAVGLKPDGTVVFYTIDGRKSGHSIGATMGQIAQRLMELGCETAICLDGGGSTTLSITEPDELTAKAVNRPSEGGKERAVTNQIFLVADSEPSGKLSHFYVSADYDYVLAGSKVNISAAAVDTNFIPMDKRYDLDTDGGELDDHVLTTPRRGGEVTVTASSGSKRGSATIQVIDDPDDVAIRGENGSILTTLNAAPGSVTQLSASAIYKHLPLKADPEAFDWEVSGNIGTVDEAGRFTGAPGKGTITVSIGGRSTSVEVTVSRLALQTVEDFEGSTTIFRGSGSAMDFSLNHGSDTVRLGRGSGELAYDLTQANEFGSGLYTAEWRTSSMTDINTSLYTTLSLWVYGDGSGNILSLLYHDGTKGYLDCPVTALDFTGWKQVTLSLKTNFAIQGLRIRAPYTPTEEGVLTYGDTARSGKVYIDHIAASFAGIVDNEVPAVTLTPNGEQLTASIMDDADGVLPKSAISVTWDGAAQSFSYDESTGILSTPRISDGNPHRITITAKDASGNIGRASYDVPAADGWTPVFTDTQGPWVTFADFLYTSGVTTGYSDGTFRPNQNITRAQFSVMLYRTLKLDESKYAGVTLPFADNKSIPEYAIPAIKALYTEGVINGSTGKDGRLYFNPGNSLTRAQAATMIGRTQAKGYATVDLTFTDTAKIPTYAAYYIQTMAAQGIIGGYTDGSFKPNNNITRGQMAKILYNLM